MNELQEFLAKMISEYEARCKEFEEYRRLYEMYNHPNEGMRHYWNGKLSEAEFTLEKLRDKQETLTNKGE